MKRILLLAIIIIMAVTPGTAYACQRKFEEVKYEQKGVCGNIDGIQQSVPDGYKLVDGDCCKEKKRVEHAPSSPPAPEPAPTPTPEPAPAPSPQPVLAAQPIVTPQPVYEEFQGK
jgi:hypothetical protein